jgi:hypothetical protein
MEQWADVLNKRLSKSQASIEYTIELAFQKYPNLSNFTQVVKEASSIINDNII